ncbi:MAG: Crp/Fnr family transcriptional regulator [Chlorobi bacterium]|nr:Crp/Fnr family transcriptional regulator [Chlorobiota bacterium]
MTSEINCNTCIIKSSAAKALNPEQLYALEKNCVQINFKKGDVIFKEGTFSGNITYLRKGVVKLHTEGKASQILKIVKGPIYLGIPTTIEEKINHYSATALEDSHLCFIHIDVFKLFIEENKQFAYEIIVELCKSELELFRKCVSRTQNNIYGRLAHALLFFMENIYESDTFTLPLSREDLGNYINTTRESVSRVLAELDTKKVIEISGKSIKILKPEQLREMSVID